MFFFQGIQMHRLIGCFILIVLLERYAFVEIKTGF